MEALLGAIGIALSFFSGYCIGFARGVIKAPEVRYSRSVRDAR